MRERAIITVQDQSRQIPDILTGFDYKIFQTSNQSSKYDAIYRNLLLIAPHRITNTSAYRHFEEVVPAYTTALVNIPSLPLQHFRLSVSPLCLCGRYIHTPCNRYIRVYTDCPRFNYFNTVLRKSTLLFCIFLKIISIAQL